MYKFKSADLIRKRCCDDIKKPPDPAAKCSVLNMVCVCVCGPVVSLSGGGVGGVQDLLRQDSGDGRVPAMGSHVSARVALHL